MNLRTFPFRLSRRKWTTDPLPAGTGPARPVEDAVRVAELIVAEHAAEREAAFADAVAEMQVARLTTEQIVSTYLARIGLPDVAEVAA